MRFIVLGLCLFLHVKSFAYTLSLSDEEKEYISRHETFKMCVNPQGAPFEEVTKEGRYKGITADIVTLITERINLQTRIQKTFTWEGSFKLSKSNLCDILTFLQPTEDNKKSFLFSQAFYQEPYTLIGRENSESVNDVSVLMNKTVAVPILGAELFILFSTKFPNLIVVPVASDDVALQMVATNKADFALRSLHSAAYGIKKAGLFNLKIIGRPLDFKYESYLSTPNSNPILHSILNKSIHSIQASEIETIINKHNTIIIQQVDDEKLNSYIIFSIAILVFISFLSMLWNRQLHQKVKDEIQKNTTMQNQLFQAAKEAEIGRIIGNISHQWRGSLAKIGALNLLTLIQLKKEQPLDKDFLFKQSTEIGKLLDFMSQTMQDFLDFYKPSQAIEAFTLHNTLTQASNILETKISNASLHVKIHGTLDVTIIGIKNQWVHIWLNVLDNTINAALNREIKNPTIDITIHQNEIIIIDNAGGIEASTPLGLGLQMCHTLCEKHGALFSYTNYHDGLKITIIFNNQPDTLNLKLQK